MAFLSNYTIPLISQNDKDESNPPDAPPAPVISGSDDFGQIAMPAAESESPPYQNTDRFKPPGRSSSDWFKNPLKRKYPPKPLLSYTTESTKDGDRIYFLGRDPGYPDELNELIQPLTCNLCGVKVNSFRPANEHYKSKAHNRAIQTWMKEKGLTPPDPKRERVLGFTGPNAYHCDLCDLNLTSLSHANQHYAGRKHKLVALNRSDPKGCGYYDDEGKWVRTATKFTPIVANDGRFGIGEDFIDKTPSEAGSENSDAKAETIAEDDKNDTKESIVEAKKVKPPPPVKEGLYCKLCEVPTTSEQQMKTHLEGSKHQKKLKLANLQGTVEPLGIKAGDSVLDSLKSETDSGSKQLADVSMYRTPSGSYYCKICDISIPQEIVLRQHLAGKKHIKKVATTAAAQPETLQIKTEIKTEIKSEII